jgi:antitoxin component YwqK of YwqJK toxin-antitoxin module
MGKFHGFGTTYSRNGQKIYEGNWNDDLYDGYGKLFEAGENLLYEGEFRNGIKLIDYENRKDGIHQEYYDNSMLKYDGEWKDGYKNGYGKGYWQDGTLWYEG